MLVFHLRRAAQGALQGLVLTGALLTQLVSSFATEDPSGVSVPAAISVSDPYRELETKYLFGFAKGTDIGAEGEKEIEFETTATFVRRGGQYRVIEQEIEFEGVPTQFFAYELSAHGISHRIRGVDGFDDLSRTTFSGLSTDLRFLLIGRGPGSPVGLTISVQPEWARIDGASGVRTQNYNATFRLAADTEIIPNRLYGVINLLYQPEVAKEMGATSWTRSSTLGVIAALAYRIAPRVTVGGELEYYRAYDGLAFKTLNGQALYAGPTLHIQFTNKVFLAAAFSAQLTGRAVGERFGLDLTNFERYHANLKLGFEF